MTGAALWSQNDRRVRVTVQRPEALPAAKQRVRALLADLALATDDSAAGSDVCRVNEAAGRPVAVSPFMLAVVEAAVDAAGRTDGLVDPTLAAAAWREVIVDHARRRVQVPPGVRLDLSATGTSLVADAAAHVIASTLGTAALVEIDGDVSVAGLRPGGWVLHVGDRDGDRGQNVCVHRGGVATSAAGPDLVDPWHRARMAPPRDRRAGVQDTRSLPRRWAVATVWADTATAANAAALSALLLDDEATTHLTELGHAARLVDRDGRVTTVGSWP